jgi:hypothetical protein
MLRYRVLCIAADIGNGNSMRAAIVDIDAVMARGGQGNQPQIRELRKLLRAQRNLVDDRNRCAAQTRYHVRGVGLWVFDVLRGAAWGSKADRQRLLVEKYCAHGRVSCCRRRARTARAKPQGA